MGAPKQSSDSAASVTLFVSIHGHRRAQHLHPAQGHPLRVRTRAVTSCLAVGRPYFHSAESHHEFTPQKNHHTEKNHRKKKKKTTQRKTTKKNYKKCKEKTQRQITKVNHETKHKEKTQELESESSSTPCIGTQQRICSAFISMGCIRMLVVKGIISIPHSTAKNVDRAASGCLR